MANANHYRPNLRDIFFNLFEYLDIGTTSLTKPPFSPDLDEATARALLEGALQVCVKDLASSYIESDKIPLKLDTQTGTVTLPEGLKQAYKTYFESGLGSIALPPSIGGMGAPPTIEWSGFEMIVGANASLALYLLGNVIAPIIEELATPAQKVRFLKPLVDNHWGGTMVLTEPDAGSDVGAGRTKATQVKDDMWKLEGVKRFITGGDFDAVDNIVHLVLARPVGAVAGTKGLSMFIVPKYLVNDDGSVGDRNGVYCTKIEKKMGITGSATCELTFGERGPAYGWLVGDVHRGIQQMFRVIQQARMSVGTKSMSELSTGYFHARDYALERTQGADMTQARDPNSARVALIRHPDVKRMLMMQKSHAEGMRALVLFNAAVQDQVIIKGDHMAEAARSDTALNEVLLPIIKGYNSEKAYELLTLSLQTLGGSGYLKDYPIEQYIRDQKIDSLYEGTTHIQALDLLARKLPKEGGAALMGLMERIQAFVEGGAVELADERKLLGTALDATREALGSLAAKATESPYYLGFVANKMLFAIAEVIIGWLLLSHAELAMQKLATAKGDDVNFYQGKIASGKFFAREVLPALSLMPATVNDQTLWLMDVPDEAY